MLSTVFHQQILKAKKGRRLNLKPSKFVQPKAPPVRGTKSFFSSTPTGPKSKVSSVSPNSFSLLPLLKTKPQLNSFGFVQILKKLGSQDELQDQQRAEQEKFNTDFHFNFKRSSKNNSDNKDNSSGNSMNGNTQECEVDPAAKHVYSSLVLAFMCLAAFGSIPHCLSDSKESKFLSSEEEVEEKEFAELIPTTFEDKEQSDDSIFKLLEIWWNIIIPQLPGFLAAAVFAMASSVISLMISAQLGLVVDHNFVTLSSSGSALSPPLIKFLSLGLVQACLQFSFSYLLHLSVENCVVALRKALFKNLLRQDISFFDMNGSKEMLSRISADVQEVQNSLKHIISVGVSNAATIIGGTVALWNLSPKLTTVVWAVVPTMVFLGSFCVSFLRKVSRDIQVSVAKSEALVHQAISNIRTVRAFSSEAKESQKYEEQLDTVSAQTHLFGLSLAVFQGLSQLTMKGLVVFGILWYGSSLVEAQELSVGQLASFMMYSSAVQRSFGLLSSLLGDVTRALSSAGRLTETLRKKPSVDLFGGVVLPSLVGNIEFCNVSFRYPSRPGVAVIKDFNLKVQAGQVVALVGKSGAGKSTIISLLERFYDPTSGVIILDGSPIVSMDPSWLRKQIGIVSQEPVLLDLSIKENICYGKPDATEEEILRASQVANCHQFISQFPEGYNTVVGENGIQLSGGQKQRIAIARAVLKDPQILILDEATSALDSESEKLVKEALDKLMKGRTVFIIAHRLSTIQSADQIVVMKKGKVVEMGSHAHLLKSDGLYSKMVASHQIPV